MWQNDLADLSALELFARSAEAVTFRGRPALKLDGLALVPGLELLDGCIEVSIAADGPCYPGIAFGLRDSANFELAYVVPHCSGLPEAIQYDPVFHGSNTWQLYNGPAYQKPATLPMGEWFTLRLHQHAGSASVQVNEQPALVVDQLAHPHLPGRVGLWTYKPAYFSGLRVLSNGHPVGEAVPVAPPLDGTVDQWFVEGYGLIQAEPNGLVNLNRLFPVSLHEVTLARRFELVTACTVQLEFGFSDELSLCIDAREIFHGSNIFKSFDSIEDRGWVRPGAEQVSVPLPAGTHELKARLLESECFGWGLTLRATAESYLPSAPGFHFGLRWRPASRA